MQLNVGPNENKLKPVSPTKKSPKARSPSRTEESYRPDFGLEEQAERGGMAWCGVVWREARFATHAANSLPPCHRR